MSVEGPGPAGFVRVGKPLKSQNHPVSKIIQSKLENGCVPAGEQRGCHTAACFCATLLALRKLKMYRMMMMVGFSGVFVEGGRSEA
jgi:hypothetical protein